MSATYGPRDWNSHPPLIFPAYRSTVRRGPTKPLVPLRQSLSELTGPVYGQTPWASSIMTSPGTPRRTASRSASASW